MPRSFHEFFRPWAELLKVQAPSGDSSLRGGDSRWNLLTYLLPTTIMIAAAFSLSSDLVGLSATDRMLVLKLYLALFAVLWLAGALTLSRWEPAAFCKVVGLLVVLVIPTVGMAFDLSYGRNSQLWFWIALVVWCAIAVVSVLGAEDLAWRKLLLVLGTIWALVGVITTIGTLRFFPYALDATESTRALHTLLDVRLLATVLFGSLLTILAFQRALGRRIGVPRIPRWYLPPVSGKDSSVARTILWPLVVISNILLEVLYALSDVAWTLVATTVAFFLRVGEEVTQLARSMIQNRRGVTTVTTVACTFFLLLILFYTAERSAGPALQYLQADEIAQSARWLGLLALNAAFGAFCVVGLTWLFESSKATVLDSSARALMLLLSMLLLSGLVMLALSRVEPLAVSGFRRIGLFSVLLLVLVGAGVVIRIRSRGLEQR
jgi:hypothetical protein